MDIEKLETPGETPLLRFYDLTKTELTLWASEDVKQGKSTKVLYFDIDTDYVKFLQEDIKTLLPYLQAFAETGQLEPQESPLQGEDERIEAIAKSSAKRVLEIIETQNNELATMQEAGVAMAQNIVEQGKRIQALQDLVKYWRSCASRGYGGDEECCLCGDCCPDLHKQTVQLLNGE